MSDDNLERHLKRFIADEFLIDKSLELDDNDELLVDGLIDSLGAIRLVGFVEESWKVIVPPQHVTVDNFGTIAQLARYIRSQTATPSGPA